MSNRILTQKRLKELLRYNPETGLFIRIKYTNSRAQIGDIAGCLDAKGYIQIKIDGEPYKAHRLAWLYVTGSFPEEQIDHKNHIRNDNKWMNLRDVTHKDNGRNKSMQVNNKSGVTGVFLNKNGNWKANIKVNNKTLYLGSYKEKNDAIIARCMAEYEYGFHKNHGS